MAPHLGAGRDHPAKLQPGLGSALKILACGPTALPQDTAVWMFGLLLVFNPNRTRVVLESHVRWQKETA